MTTPTKKKHRLTNLVIDEISFVDRPANPHAKVTLLKRADDENEKEHRMDDLSKIASFDSLDDAVEAIATAAGCPRHAAMSRVAKQHPDLVAAYNAEGKRIAEAAAATPRSISKAVADFETIVRGIMARDGVSRTEALRRARVDNPGAFAAYQAA